MEYTKGEWEVYIGHDGQFKDRPIILSQYKANLPNKTIAEVCYISQETEANARLISASPDMYEALKSIADSYKAEKGMTKEWDMVFNAIDKAEGKL